jgi:hypothetical protein
MIPRQGVVSCGTALIFEKEVENILHIDLGWRGIVS